MRGPLKVIENEYHFLMVCPAYRNLANEKRKNARNLMYIFICVFFLMSFVMCISCITICVCNCHALLMPPLLCLYVRMRNTMCLCPINYV